MKISPHHKTEPMILAATTAKKKSRAGWRSHLEEFSGTKWDMEWSKSAKWLQNDWYQIPLTYNTFRLDEGKKLIKQKVLNWALICAHWRIQVYTYPRISPPPNSIHQQNCSFEKTHVLNTYAKMYAFHMPVKKNGGFSASFNGGPWAPLVALHQLCRQLQPNLGANELADGFGNPALTSWGW